MLPRGYTELGNHSVLGVGRVSKEAIDDLSKDTHEVTRLRAQLAEVDLWLKKLQADKDSVAGDLDTQGAVLALNRLANRARELGLIGPGTQL